MNKIHEIRDTRDILKRPDEGLMFKKLKRLRLANNSTMYKIIHMMILFEY